MNILLLGEKCSLINDFLLSSNHTTYIYTHKLNKDDVTGYDFVISFGYRHIIKQEIIDLFPDKIINMHISLLPYNKGADPNLWSYLENSPKGVTIHKIDKGLDTGDMLEKVVVPLDPKETGESLHDKLSVAGNDILLKAMKAIEDGTAVREKQDDSMSTYAPMFDKAMGEIDWTKDAKELERLIRGLYPWPSAYTHFGTKVMKVFSADVVERQTKEVAGTIVEVTKDSIVVQAGNNCLALKEVQLEGKKRMEVKAFLLGYAIKAGEQFKKEK